ncbi:MAG: hypothetical protein P1V81_08840 [Planctomycetota bacterium]|nr:hypothetical protein [Planctomycetota bacterium]
MPQPPSGHLRRFQFALERWVQRGILPQLVLMAILVVAVAVLGGVAAWALTPAFDSLPTAIWWSFLRLTDPGYLGDDEGLVLRVVSTVVTVLGYVLFMGSLIAIMTQWLALTIRKLESGLTPIAMENHFVILGWTNRTTEIVKKLLTAGGRIERFFAHRKGSDKLRVVILAEEVDAQLRQDLRDSLGKDWSESQVFLRSGSSLQLEHLQRLDILRAAVVIVPGADFELGGAELNDTRVVKTLLTVDALFRKDPAATTPCVVAELFDPHKVTIADNAIRARSEIITGDRLISRLLSQSLRHPGAGTVLLRLLTHREGNGLYLRAFPELVGATPRGLIQRFPRAVVLGVVSNLGDATTVRLDPTVDVTVEQGDLLILLAQKFDDCIPIAASSTEQPPARVGALAADPRPERQRLLILGWSYKIPTLLAELLESGRDRFDVTILSKVDRHERTRALSHLDLEQRVEVHMVEGDYSLERDLKATEPHSFDHVLFLASGWMQSSEEADARTVLGLLLLRSLLEGHTAGPEVLVELLDPGNASILGAGADVTFVSSRILSHLLAHVGLLPELNEVFDELICAGGTEIELRSVQDLGLEPDGVTFAQVQASAAGLGCVGLGFFAALETDTTQQVYLNPTRERPWKLRQTDRVILLSNVADGAA